MGEVGGGADAKVLGLINFFGLCRLRVFPILEHATAGRKRRVTFYKCKLSAYSPLIISPQGRKASDLLFSAVVIFSVGRRRHPWGAFPLFFLLSNVYALCVSPADKSVCGYRRRSSSPSENSPSPPEYVIGQ